MWQRTALNSWSLCLSILSAGITVVLHHVWLSNYFPYDRHYGLLKWMCLSTHFSIYKSMLGGQDQGQRHLPEESFPQFSVHWSAPFSHFHGICLYFFRAYSILCWGQVISFMTLLIIGALGTWPCWSYPQTATSQWIFTPACETYSTSGDRNSKKTKQVQTSAI